jgi:N4-gp56 family major capsid protein
VGDVFTDTTQLTQATTAYERYAYFALRPELYFNACASIKPTRQSHPGSAVLFNIYNELAPAVTPIAQNADVDAVAVTDAEVTISLNEYGNAVISSARIRGWSYLVVSQDLANVVGFNAGLSFDCLARNPLLAGTNVIYSGTGNAARADVAAGDHLTARNVREVGANLTNNNVQRVMNGYYKAFISPLVAIDLREEVGAASWRDPHTYTQPEQIWNGEVGAFESFSFIETPRLSAANLETAQGGPGGFVNGGTTSEDVHPTLFLGQQALAKTWSSAVSAPEPQIILGTVVDKLQRFVPLGWYWNGGFGRFREASLYRVESASSLTA